MSELDDALRSFRFNRRLWTAKRARIVPICELTPGTEARVTGKVAPAQTTLIAPFSRTPCVFWFVRLEERHEFYDNRTAWGLRSEGGMQWREEIRDRSRASFWLRDPSGSDVLVDLHDARGARTRWRL